jgi:hypothetical protein
MAPTDAEIRAAEEARKKAEKAVANCAAALDAYEASHAAVHSQVISVLNIWVLMLVVLIGRPTTMAAGAACSSLSSASTPSLITSSST